MQNLLRALGVLFLIFALYADQSAIGSTTLLPNGKQCFTGPNGLLQGGSINMFRVATTTPKQTWQDSGQSVLNTQPIQLDANGCAIIYGVGAYRQQVFDGPVVAGVTTGNLIWDQITTDTSAFNSTFWALTSGGTPNVLTVSYPGFNATDGTIINFIALNTNTASATLNPSGFGAILIVKDTTGGPVVLTGGEIIAGNLISVTYVSATNTFHLNNTVIPSTSGSSAPICGAVGLTITNSVGTPSTILTMTASQAVMISGSGQVINRTNVALASINISTGTVTSTANGMDGEAPGTSAWLYIWMIDNGSGAAGLVSTSSTSPTLPNGYTYKCRMGAMRVDGAGNLLRTLQKGSRARYTVVAATNTAALPQMASGAVVGNTATPTWVAIPIGNFVPTTATIISVGLSTWEPAASAIGIAILAPNNAYGGHASTTNPPPMRWVLDSIAGGLTGGTLLSDLMLETANLYWASNVTGSSAVLAAGWIDAVNAN